jgi:hypothetical protein
MRLAPLWLAEPKRHRGYFVALDFLSCNNLLM